MELREINLTGVEGNGVETSGRKLNGVDWREMNMGCVELSGVQ